MVNLRSRMTQVLESWRVMRMGVYGFYNHLVSLILLREGTAQGLESTLASVSKLLH